MVKFNGKFDKLHWYAYWADGGINEGIRAYDIPSTIGFRGKYSWAGLDAGASSESAIGMTMIGYMYLV